VKRLLAVVAVALVVCVAGGAAADTFSVRLVSQTNTTITLGWDAQPGYGYLFSAGGVLVSRTNDASRTSVKFSKVTPASYDIDVIVKGANGHYPSEPPLPPPPKPAASLNQTILSGSTVSGTVVWQATYDGNGDGVPDDPGSMRFSVDGNVVLTETTPPFGDTAGFWDSTTVGNGSHTFKVEAVSDSGTVVVANTVTASVSNGTQPPPPPTGFPNASNTGVPAGTTLTAYTGPSNITTAGTVINGKSIGCLQISAPGVVIRNSKISCNGFYALLQESGGAPMLIEDSEIDCQGSNGTGLADSNFTARRLDISGCENGLSINHDMTIEDSYIHDLTNSAEAHLDGIQFDPYVNANNITIRHNTIYGMGSDGSFGTSAIIDHSFRQNSNVLIDGNLMAGGAATIYCSIGFTGINYRVTNNAFSTKFKSTVGFYFPSTECSDETQSGNYIYETGQPLHLD